MKTWIKYGLIALCIWFLIFLYFLYDTLTCNGFLCGLSMAVPFAIALLLSGLIGLVIPSFQKSYNPSTFSIISIIIFIILQLLIIFAIGAIIGLIVQKVRKNES